MILNCRQLNCNFLTFVNGVVEERISFENLANISKDLEVRQNIYSFRTFVDGIISKIAYDLKVRFRFIKKFQGSRSNM